MKGNYLASQLRYRDMFVSAGSAHSKVLPTRLMTHVLVLPSVLQTLPVKESLFQHQKVNKDVVHVTLEPAHLMSWMSHHWDPISV